MPKNLTSENSNIGSGNGLVSSGTNWLPGPLFTQIDVVKLHPYTFMGYQMVWLMVLNSGGHWVKRPSNRGISWAVRQIARFRWPPWGPSGSCRPQVAPMLAPWTLLSEVLPTKLSGFQLKCIQILMAACLIIGTALLMIGSFIPLLYIGADILICQLLVIQVLTISSCNYW